MPTSNLDKAFNPTSVAIIGASDEEGSVGNAIVKNFSRGYSGKVYYVNMRKPEINGVKTYPTVGQINSPVDLAMIATPAKTVPDVVEQCGKAGIKSAIIVSAGFKETGPDGKALETKILEIAQRYGLRIIGPNCIGIIRPKINLNATFVDKSPKPGNIAFLSQSGALGSAILDWAIQENIGFSNFVSVGSMIDVDFGDLIDYFGSDPDTTSILMYVEGLTDARKFMSAARQFSRTKPIIVVKSGKFSESAKAAASHTGSMSGEDNIYDAAFRRAGIVRVEEIADLFNSAEVLGTQPLPKGPNLAIITNAGGPGVMTTDALIARGGKIASLESKTIDSLNCVLPPFWSHGNPVDILGDAKADRYKAAVEACLEDGNIDGILVIFTQQSVSEPVEIARNLAEIANSGKHPKKTILTSFMGSGKVQEANSILNANNIPTYSTPEQAVKTYMYMYQYQENLETLYETPEYMTLDSTPAKRPIMVILRNVAAEERDLLTEDEAKRLLKYYNFPVIVTKVAKTADQAVDLAQKIGYPIALKILSPQIAHKTDAGGVVLNITSESQVRWAFETVTQKAIEYNSEANIIGVTVQQMVKTKGTELIIGGKTDPLFGPVILFGMGGVGVELFKDYAMELPPLNTSLIRTMIQRTKVYQLLKGYRNSPPANIPLLEEILAKFSQLLVDFPQIKEIDINPLLLNENEAVILDARIVIDKERVFNTPQPYEHLAITPYPKKYEKLITLRDGQNLLLRPIRPEDEPMWQELFQNTSEESIRHPWFKKLKDAPHEIRIRYCNIDYDREIAIVAEQNDKTTRKLLGVGRLATDPDRKMGEITFIVGDKYQSKGLGKKMVDYVLDVTKEMGIEQVQATIPKDNDKAISIARKMGFTFKNRDAMTIVGTLDLKDEAATVHNNHHKQDSKQATGLPKELQSVPAA
jgi:acetyltransferase